MRNGLFIQCGSLSLCRTLRGMQAGMLAYVVGATVSVGPAGARGALQTSCSVSVCAFGAAPVLRSGG